MAEAQQKPTNFEYAQQVCEYLPSTSYKQALKIYDTVLNDPNLDDYVTAQMGLHDRFFFLTMILRASFIFETNKPEWIYERTREVEVEPDGYLDLWAREHFKSTVITFAGCIQEIAKDSPIYQDLKSADAWFRGPGKEITIGIFANKNQIARDFVSKIKRECEDNVMLPRLYPTVFWDNPKKQAPTWSRDDGLIMKRTSNPNESTLSGWGLVDSLPTSKHFKLSVYDDTVTEKSVGTPEMILKTTTAWELSDYLSSRIHPDMDPRKWHIGTRYNYADTYGVMINRGSVKPRIYAATEDGTPDGTPIFISDSQWEQKKRDASPYTLACQMLQNPIAGSEQEFKPEWIRRYEVRPETLNIAILVDPANSKKKGTSNTAFAVIGKDAQHNKYLLDGACHKMALPEKWKMLKALRSKWLRQPGVQLVKVGYEKYGMQADIEHYKEMMKIEKAHFPIEEVSWTRDGLQSKDDRIRRLVADHHNAKFFYPYSGDKTSLQIKKEHEGKPYLIAKPIKRINENERLYDLVEWFMSNEYLFFPATTAKDLFDAISRIYDIDLPAPVVYGENDIYPEHEGDY